MEELCFTADIANPIAGAKWPMDALIAKSCPASEFVAFSLSARLHR
jgi:hypothetical protein